MTRDMTQICTIYAAELLLIISRCNDNHLIKLSVIAKNERIRALTYKINLAYFALSCVQHNLNIFHLIRNARARATIPGNLFNKNIRRTHKKKCAINTMMISNITRYENIQMHIIINKFFLSYWHIYLYIYLVI